MVIKKRYKIVHITRYIYNGQVSLCQNEAMVTPRGLPGQLCLAHDLHVSPKPELLSEREDYYGNTVHHFSVEKTHDLLTIKSESTVERELSDIWQPPALTCEASAQRLQAQMPEDLDARHFLHPSTHISPNDEIRAYALASFSAGRSLYEAVLDLNHRINEDFTFLPGSTNIFTPLHEVMRMRSGVCQDFAHIAIACLRSVGLAARYVSGYIETIPPPGMPKLVGADATHAWVSVYFPGTGWLDLDPTNDKICDAHHITVAWGRDYADVIPVKGVIYSNASHVLEVSVDVREV